MAGYGPFRGISAVNICELHGRVVVRAVSTNPEAASVSVMGKNSETVEVFKNGNTLFVRSRSGGRSGSAQKTKVRLGESYQRHGRDPEVEIAVSAQIVTIIDKK